MSSYTSVDIEELKKVIQDVKEKYSFCEIVSSQPPSDWIVPYNGFEKGGVVLKKLKELGLKSSGSLKEKPSAHNGFDAGSTPARNTTIYPEPFPEIYSLPTTQIRKQKDNAMDCKTQKAQSVVNLAGMGNLAKFNVGKPVIYGVYPRFIYHQSIKFPLFARPAPVRPRHGFVDSRVINSWEELANLYMETIQADEADAEIILMPKLKGKYSGVATHAGVSWGFGHDGVTGGKGRSYTIPAPSDKHAWNKLFSYDDYFDKRIETGIKDTGYLEFVTNNVGKVTSTQFRDGPEPPNCGKNFIPKDITVGYVLVTRDFESGDLLGWEKAVKKMHSQFPDTGIIYAKGHSLASHFVVHGIQLGIPVITSLSELCGVFPEPGVYYKATKNTTPPLEDKHYKKIAVAVMRELTRSSIMKSSGGSFGHDECLTAVSTTQIQHMWGTDKHLLRLRGVSLAWLARLGFAACLGELRHMKHGRATVYPYGTSFPEHNYRGSIYNDVLFYSQLPQMLDLYPDIIRDFRFESVAYDEDEDGNIESWEDGFGGDAWADVADNSGRFAQALGDFLSSPTEESYAEAIMKANVFINSSHNNGKVLTKWLCESALSAITDCPVVGFINRAAGNVVLNTEEDH